MLSKKQKIILLSFIILFCNCSSLKKATTQNLAQKISEEVNKQTETIAPLKMAELPKEDPPKEKDSQKLKIRKKGKTYELEFDINLHDENITWNMEFPKEEEEKKEEKEEPDPVIPAQKLPEKTNEIKPEERKEASPENKDNDVKPENKDENNPDENEKLTNEEFTRLLNQSSKHLLLAQKYFYEKKYDHALSEINEVLFYTPKSAIGQSLKGSIYFELGNHEQAKIFWKRALKIDPTLSSVREGLKKLENGN